MALREKFGRLVLLEETDKGPLGSEYRAARLGPTGFDRLVTVLRFSQRVSADAEATKRLVDEAKVAAQIHSPGLVKMLGVGRVGPSYYLSTELVEGRTVAAVLAECREGGFPFGPDHALMIASRAAAGLESLHGKKDEAGRPLLHGLIAPRQLVVAFDGEVKVKGLGLWSALGGGELLAAEERAYLAPEQATVHGDERSDVYALGLVLLETLTGQAPDGGDAAQRIGSAKMTPPGGEPSPLPKPLADVLRRALAADPAARFPGMAELRRGIDALLFSGDFTPTTFDLAFFMHTLFREAVEQDARAVEEARGADYREFLTEEAAKPAAGGSPQTEPASLPSKAAEPEAQTLATTEVQPPTAPDPAPRPAPPPAQAKPAAATSPEGSHPRLSARAARDGGARDATSRSGVGLVPAAPASAVKRRPPSPGLWLGIGVAAAVLLGGGGGWLYFVRQRPAAPPPPTAEQVAAEARVRELEARIAQLETEKAAAEAKAAEEARQAVEKQAAAGGQAADPEAIQRAQEEARRRVRLEQERQQQEELQRIADEKRAEEQRLAAAVATAKAVSAAATPLPAPVSTPTPLPGELVPPSPTQRAASDGGLSTAQPVTPPQAQSQAPSTQATPGVPVAGTAPATARIAPADPADPAVRAPGLLSEDPVPYPRRGAALRLTTTVTVVVRALIDETGRVSEASISQGSGQPAEMGFDEAALRRVRSRKYRPARRLDVPVPIWVVIRVEFRPPPVR